MVKYVKQLVNKPTYHTSIVLFESRIRNNRGETVHTTETMRIDHKPLNGYIEWAWSGTGRVHRNKVVFVGNDRVGHYNVYIAVPN